MIVIDTSLTISFLRGEARSVGAVKSVMKTTDSLGMPTVSLFELLHPIHHRKLERQERIVRAFVHQLRLLAFDADAAEEGAKIMGDLMRIGQPVNPLDVMIAGTAVANGAEKLLTSDRDFEKIAKVSGLKVEIIH